MKISLKVTDDNIPVKLNEQKPSFNLSLKSDTVVVKKQIANDFNLLQNKPQINGVELQGDKTFEELGVREFTNTEIMNIINIAKGGK